MSIEKDSWGRPIIYKHKMSHTRPHRIWMNMRQRCSNKNRHDFKYYGGKGIRVCKEWQTFKGFWGDMKDGYEDNLTIDRVDTNGNYEPGNCRWSTQREQMNNFSKNRIVEFNNQKKTMSEWAASLGMKYYNMRDRIDRYGWSIERALTTPKKVTQ